MELNVQTIGIFCLVSKNVPFICMRIFEIETDKIIGAFVIFSTEQVKNILGKFPKNFKEEEINKMLENFSTLPPTSKYNFFGVINEIQAIALWGMSLNLKNKVLSDNNHFFNPESQNKNNKPN